MRDGEQVGVTVDVEAFRSTGDGMLLLAGGKLTLAVTGETVLLLAAVAGVAANFSRLPARSEQKLASDEHEATHSSLLAVDALFRLLFANDSTS